MFELEFDELHANFPNLFIAPNGFGKSTIAITFEALKPNKIELYKEDFHEGREENKPVVKIEIVGDNEATLIADSTKNEISKIIDTYVINNPVYAKSTSRRIGGFSTKSAALHVEDLVLYDKIPSKSEIKYSISKFKEIYGNKAKIFSNVSEIFKSPENLSKILENHNLLEKCKKQIKPQMAIQNFINAICEDGTAKRIKEAITNEVLDIFKSNANLLQLSEIVKEFEKLPFNKNNEVDVILTTIQLVNIFKDEDNDIKKAWAYADYLYFRQLIDARLNLYNTTGRTIKTKESNGKLIIEFFAANKMSNGERDVLSFISHLSKFEVKFSKNIGILIIDEIFDYLDGSNMLIVQYYLSKFIDDSKNNGKIIFPLILTHLDPSVFGNYYFKKPKVHYLKKYACISDNLMLSFLRIRSNKTFSPQIKEKIESYFLHYNPMNIQFNTEEKEIVQDSNYQESSLFYNMITNEIQKYLSGEEKYDPLKVICAIRVKVEELVYSQLPGEQEKEQYIKIHTTVKKLNYALEHDIDVDEMFFLLQPLYNDALHMDENDFIAKNKIQSACLKLDNNIVRNIVGKLFS